MSALPPPAPPAPLPPLADDAHKGDAGRLLCVVGRRTMPGAAILVARAAHRGGAGLVTVACLDPELLAVLPPVSPETVLVELDADALGREGADLDVLVDARRAHARVAGPGLGDDDRTRAVVAALLASPFRGPLVLDADALNALDGEPERARAARGPVVLTPHPGEAGRLLGRDVPRDADGRRAAARELARRAGAVVCLKGRGTVVADAERAWTNDTGNAGLATGGTGDVLTGLLGAHLARRAAAAGGALDADEVFEGARLAVRLHGLAGDVAAERVGRDALVASDLVDALPEAARRLAAG